MRLRILFFALLLVPVGLAAADAPVPQEGDEWVMCVRVGSPATCHDNYIGCLVARPTSEASICTARYEACMSPDNQVCFSVY